MLNFWAGTLRQDLSQGDLLRDVWVGTSANPRTGLKRAIGKGGKTIWGEAAWQSGTDGFGHFLAKGRSTHSIVLSQDCEIDKDAGAAPVLIAPVFPLTVVQTASMQQNVRDGRRYAFLYLPESPGTVPESYADLRCTTYLHRPIIDASPRILSAADEGRRRLITQLVAFLTRVPIDQIILAKLA